MPDNLDVLTREKLFPSDRTGPDSICSACGHLFNALFMNPDGICNSCKAEQLRLDELENEAPIVEEQWNDIKAKRNQILNETLWTIQPDSPLTVECQADFATYRRTLHRLTIDFTDPDDVVWPTIPEQVF